MHRRGELPARSIVATYDRDSAGGAVQQRAHSDRALDAMALRASTIMDDERREAARRDAVETARTRQPMIQLLQYVNTWAHRRGLRHEPRMDERTVAMGVRPALAAILRTAGATGRIDVSFTVAIASSVSTRCTPGRVRSSSLRKVSSAGRSARRSFSR